MQYVLENAQGAGNLVDWLTKIKVFFGEEKAEEFCEYYIQSHQMIRKEDIRNLLPRYTLSVYWAMEQEQLAFVSAYHGIDRESNLIRNRENGLEKAQQFYRKKDEELASKIRGLGYSYVAIETNWKDKQQKDTYQRDYTFCIFSEKDTEETFKQNIICLAKTLRQEKVLITNCIRDKGPKAQIPGKIYQVLSGKEVENYPDLVISDLEKYLADLSGTKVMFRIPYEKNKHDLFHGERKIGCHYSLQKQESVTNARVDSFNMGMLKQGLVHQFQKTNKT